MQNKQGPCKTNLGGWDRGKCTSPPPPPLPQFNAKQKKLFCRNYSISFLFSHKEHLKRVFKASREVQMQNFKTMMVAVRTAYITVAISFWPLHSALIKQIKVQLSVYNVCNKVHCIFTNSRASQPDRATSAYFPVFCGTFLRNHVILISKKCCLKHLRIT